VVGSRARGSWDGSPPVGSRDEAPVRGLGNEIPQKLKQYRLCEFKLAYNFNVFLYEIKDLMSIGSELDSIFCRHIIQIFFEYSMGGGFEPLTPLWVLQW